MNGPFGDFSIIGMDGTSTGDVSVLLPNWVSTGVPP